jgi:hypothetical protein
MRLTPQNQILYQICFVSCFSARPLTQATIADSLQWGCDVAISAIHPFLLEKNEKADQTNFDADPQLFRFCHLCIIFLGLCL